MSQELPKLYDPGSIEPRITERWLEHKAFGARPDEREQRYVIMMPLPNVTGALHMGHAIDNVMQDLLIRWHRMQGENTLWMAGTDHAGIATQAVVEKRLFEHEGKTRDDVGRGELVRRIWEWKDEYQERIVKQQQAMGCSCDWDRQRFTMDAVCARAVRHTFFKMFRDGLIYRGHRLVNWDCQLRTAVADDELFRKPVPGHFWHLRYPVIDPQPGEPTHIVVATTRPETMLGDTAVACHPDPEAALEAVIGRTREKHTAATAKEKPEIEAELERLEARRTSHVPELETIANMAAEGRQVQLPLQERPIPIITDEWAKPDLGSGCVKITPGHDPNDYDVWTRHRGEIEIVNILEENGTLNQNAGSFAGQDRFDAREAVVAALQERELIEATEDRSIEIDHSDRSKTIIEPFLSRQWFVRMGDVEGGVRMGVGTPGEFTSPGLAQSAIDAASAEWRSSTGRNVSFHPDDRYRRTYNNWLAEKRDWCISRQLWWGHQIPVWQGRMQRQQLLAIEGLVRPWLDRDDVCAWVILPGERWLTPTDAFDTLRDSGDTGERDSTSDAGDANDVDVLVCFLDEATEQETAPILGSVGLSQEQDVLDTWFSSGVWPHSTLGWPDPATARVDDGQSPVKAQDGQPDCLSYYYPGSCLVTGRDIITLWVARMLVMGLYNLGDVPFTDVFVHANIQDGKGDRMSKSNGNGIDPVDIIDKYGTDAMRYVLCEMQTGTQDVRLPVHVESPFTGKTLDLATASHGRSIFTYVCPETGKEFDVLGTMKEEGVPGAKPYSTRFEIGRNFCNKLWNSARFAFLNLDGAAFEPRTPADLPIEDRWILSRLSAAREEVHRQLEAYNPSAALAAAREAFWAELCDWYLELIKPRMREDGLRPVAQQVLATALDQILRLLHPVMPFITEELWEKLNESAPRRGIEQELANDELLVRAAWPEARPTWRDPAAEQAVGLAQEIVGVVREIRARYEVPSKQKIELVMAAPETTRAVLGPVAELIAEMTTATAELGDRASDRADAATAVVRDVEISVSGVVDLEKEKQKLEKERTALEGRIQGMRKRLDNPGFVAKAPPDVVERERKNLASLEAQLQSIRARLESLG